MPDPRPNYSHGNHWYPYGRSERKDDDKPKGSSGKMLLIVLLAIIVGFVCVMCCRCG